MMMMMMMINKQPNLNLDRTETDECHNHKSGSLAKVPKPITTILL